MGAGAFIEPAVVIGLLFGGTWINRNSSYRMSANRRQHHFSLRKDPEDLPSIPDSPSLLAAQEPRWRKREVKVFGLKRDVTTPNTRVFRGRLLSRLLRKFPFLVEAWYWALIYWVYQLGRAFTAVTLVEGTVDVARTHALQLIHLEKRLHIFWELPIQHFFLRHTLTMTWINRIYSFIHIPGTILFLVWLYYYTTTKNRLLERQSNKEVGAVDGSPAGPLLYEARRRTMATCNLLAFVVFTLWPCMPPRLLSDRSVPGAVGEEARSFGFVDTVHGKGGESSVWTENRFCNQYAAMPSLHFGYSLLIGLTVLSIPLAPHHHHSRTLTLNLASTRCTFRLPSPRRLACVFIGIAYPLLILVAIIATANHFILDAVAGAVVCGLAWNGNAVLLNLLVVEDWFLWALRMHKPEKGVVEWDEGRDERGEMVTGKGVYGYA
ncbi:integral membrane protein [Aulographum hederae CBS 113979]|uniref:Integral membrane protein n=1 Tax=Aulographum hederae CBS 113979 TaxID=1176131 RepID=A0A6G1HA48_9PEZI|nr:integral membrane protein [Aulographum hederae CBS 113979]